LPEQHHRQPTRPLDAALPWSLALLNLAIEEGSTMSTSFHSQSGSHCRWLERALLVTLFCCASSNVFSATTETARAASLEILPESASCDASGPFTAEVKWRLEEAAATKVELRIKSASGTLFAEGGRSGSAKTGKWVVPGLRFVLRDPGAGEVLAEVIAQKPVCEKTRAGGSGALPQQAAPIGQSTLVLSPPRVRSCGKPVSVFAVEVRWHVESPAGMRVEVRLNDPDGKVFAHGGATGKARTGEWVKDGMRFFLVEANGGRPLADAVFEILPCSTVAAPS
jgi:hypothetical protein